MILEPLNECPGTDGTLSAFLAIPGNAENLRERFWRDARRIGLSEADADDGAQQGMMMLCKWGDHREDGTIVPPVRAFFAARKYLRRSLYRGFTGLRRDRKRKMVATGDREARQRTGNARGESFPDNPATIVAALETAAARLSRAMGRNAAAVRGMTEADIRGLAMPDMRGLAEREAGECPRVVESIPGACKPSGEPVPATPGDGTEWRACGDSVAWAAFPDAYREAVSNAREAVRAAGWKDWSREADDGRAEWAAMVERFAARD
jgi:DNA-directed RNA polymerase specialized sigma24 family protein